MNIKERYDRIIKEIEKQYEGNNSSYIKTRELAENIAISEGMSYRDMNTSFMFITGMSLQDYIRSRRLMAVYKDIVNSDNFNINRYIEKSGYGDQSALGKAFKEKFDMAPKQVFDSKDKSLYEGPLSWDKLSNKDSSEVTIEDSHIVDTLFGIDKQVIEKYEEVRNLQCLYEFDNEISEICFRVSRDYDIPLRQIFEYMDEVLIKNDGNLPGNNIDSKYKLFVRGRNNHFNLLKFTDWSIDEMDENLELMFFIDTDTEKLVIKDSDGIIVDLWKNHIDYDFNQLRKLYKEYSKQFGEDTKHFDYLLGSIERTGYWEEDLEEMIEYEKSLYEQERNKYSRRAIMEEIAEEKYNNSVYAFLDERELGINRDNW